jgi:hypothetical protein
VHRLGDKSILEGEDVRNPDGANPDEDDQCPLVGSDSGENEAKMSPVKNGPKKEVRPKRSRKPNPKYFRPN